MRLNSFKWIAKMSDKSRIFSLLEGIRADVSFSFLRLFARENVLRRRPCHQMSLMFSKIFL